MKSVEAIKILHGCDLEGRILFRSRELGVLFGESGDTLRSTIKRLTADGILERIAHDAYLYLLFHPNGCDLLGHIAAFLRPGEVTYTFGNYQTVAEHRSGASSRRVRSDASHA